LVLISLDAETIKKKSWEINLGRLSLIVVFAFGGFIIAEITLPGLAPSAWERGVFVIPQSEVRYPKPYVMFGGEPNAAGLNRLGYPGPAPAEEKPAGEFRIFILGGSTVFNHPGSIASALQDAYHRNGDDHVRVFNFGVVSSVSGMDLARIVYEVADHQPDLIIMYNGGNDLLNNWGREDRPGYPFDFVYTENNPLLYLSDPTAAERDRYQGWTLFLLESRLLRRLLKDDLEEALIKRKLRPNDLGAPGSPQWQQALAATYIKHLALGHRVAKGLEARFLGVFQPILFFKTPHVGRERQINAYLENTDWGRQRKRGAHEMRAMITEGMRRLRDTEGMDLLDLSALFSKRRDAVFTDQIHITETARAAVGKAIFEHLERAGIGAGNL
ncbi:MAG: SGNH/GDSL hydrolase family protein, partial [Magnetovibrio sp.]|nr:SGNH/GDSL hydrolase family protein [Magnetovibrio sp.]